MMQQTSLPPVPLGCEEKVDLQLDEASFPKIRSLLAKHNSICRVQTLSRKADSFLLNEPNLIRHVLLSNKENYIKGIGFERAKLILGNGIIVSDGDFWKRQRRLVQPAFHRNMLKALTATLQDISRQWLVSWQTLAETNTPFDLTRSMSGFALDVMLRSLFSEDVDKIRERAGHNPFDIFTENHARDLSLALKFRELMKLVHEVVVQRRKKTELPPDMLSALMTSEDKEGEGMSDKALLDELMTLIVAGHETSAITLSWMWHLLARHPGAELKLHAELEQAGEKDSPEYEDVEKMQYCKQLMFETLRLYPPVWLFSRRALQADVIGGYQIPAGADLFISPYFLHRREDYWPDPEKFNPDRFSPENEKNLQSNAFIPFSAGRRKCIGDAFSLLEIAVHFGTIARKLVLRPLNPDAEIGLEPEINLRSKEPIIMVPHTRSTL